MQLLLKGYIVKVLRHGILFGSSVLCTDYVDISLSWNIWQKTS